MSDIIEALKYSTEIVGKLRKLNRTAGEADFQMHLADLTNSLADAKLDAANLKLELAAAMQRVAELEGDRARKAAAGPTLDEGAYIFDDPSRHYCTGCYDASGRKSLLTRNKPPFDVFGSWQCPVCKQTIG